MQREFHASETQADGSGAAIGDFLVGDKRFTTFVEIKKPSTPLFGASLNRGKAWSLSRDLTDAVSQILEHKASGQIRIETQRLHDSNGQPITQRAYDPKVLLIIGHWNHVESVNDNEKGSRKKNLELYRRDSRNIELLTFDELLERAKFIVEHGEKKDL